uniref:ubiquitinyl hydrolase 1 n=2 Tax=Mesocestoides corti TaxID=53468 RepID=A0A5K3FEB5_MESCO
MNFGYFSLKRSKDRTEKAVPVTQESEPKQKNSLSESVKKGLENSSREKLLCESTMANYNKSRSIGVEDEIRARGGEASRKKSVKDPLPEVKAVVPHNHVSAKIHSQPTRKVDTPSGLENFGNTCYISATLQCLRSTEVIRTYCVEKRYENSLLASSKSSGDLFPAFANLITRMHLTSNGTVGSNYIQKFKNAFTKIVPIYNGNLQQDALEFFTYLLDALHEEIKDRPDSPSSTEQQSSKTPPVLPANRKRRHRLRFGGLKATTSSVQLASNDAFDECQLASAMASKPPSPVLPKSTRKWSLRVILPKYVKPKVRPLSTGWIDRQTLDACRAAVNSAEAIADEKSFLKDTFVGHLQTHLQCLQCNNVSKHDELFWNLALCVPEVHSPDKAVPSDATKTTATAPPPTPDASVTLDDCLRAFTKAEILDGLDRPNCEHCKMPTKARIQAVISKLPRILVLRILFRFITQHT